MNGAREQQVGTHEARGQISMGASIYGLAQAAVCIWRSENSFLELLLSSHCVEPGD